MSCRQSIEDSPEAEDSDPLFSVVRHPSHADELTSTTKCGDGRSDERVLARRRYGPPARVGLVSSTLGPGHKGRVDPVFR